MAVTFFMWRPWNYNDLCHKPVLWQDHRAFFLFFKEQHSLQTNTFRFDSQSTTDNVKWTILPRGVYKHRSYKTICGFSLSSLHFSLNRSTHKVILKDSPLLHLYKGVLSPQGCWRGRREITAWKRIWFFKRGRKIEEIPGKGAMAL